MAKLKIKPQNKLLLLKAKKTKAQDILLRNSEFFQKIEAQLAADHFTEAEKLLTQLRDEHPHSPLVLSRIGLVNHKLGHLAVAEQYFRLALTIDPHNAEALTGFGILATEQNQVPVAAQLFQQALKVEPNNYQALDGLGWLWLISGETILAKDFFINSVTICPHFTAGLFHLGLTHAKLGNLQEAAINYRLATIVNPKHAEAYNNWGIIQATQGAYDDAETSYRRALEITPDNINTLCNLAELYEKTNKLREAKELVEMALALEPQTTGASRLMATLLRRQGKAEEALSMLKSVPIPSDNPEKALEIHYELARLSDQLGKYESAFQHFRKTKELQALSPLAQKFDKNNFLRGLTSLANYFTSDRLTRWSEQTPMAAASDCPIFLVGFPRSGTTLLDQILDSHPDFQVVEESAALEIVISRINALPEGYPVALDHISEDTLTELRREYFRNLSGFAGQNTTATQMIDKYPLHIMHLGLIYRLFPQAKIILAIRHPYDVCLSNFMQLFKINDAMANFLNIYDTSFCYNQVMGLALRYLDTLPLRVHRIRYEDLVDDFTTTASELLSFLGADWDEKVTRYYEHAQSRGMIATPSYHQVTEPIYQRAKFRFKHYATVFADCHDLLQPYITRFDYPNVEDNS